MRHSRSIDLSPSSGTEFDTETIASLPEWYVLEAECGACHHSEVIYRRPLIWKFGKNIRLPEVAARLRCKCGKKGNNTLRLGRLPR